MDTLKKAVLILALSTFAGSGMAARTTDDASKRRSAILKFCSRMEQEQPSYNGLSKVEKDIKNLEPRHASSILACVDRVEKGQAGISSQSN